MATGMKISDSLLRAKKQVLDRYAVLDIVIIPEITEVIRQAGLEPTDFVVDKASLKAFVEKPNTHKEDDGLFGCVYYDHCTKDVIYRAQCKITFAGEDVCDETSIFKLEDYRSGNRKWLRFSGSDWQQGPGEELFSVDEITRKV